MENFGAPNILRYFAQFTSFRVDHLRNLKMDTDTISNAAIILALFMFIYRQCSRSPSQSHFKYDRPKLYLTIVFWHSVLLTASVPLFRVFYKRWYAHIPLNWLYTNIRVLLQPQKESIIRLRYPTTSFAYPTGNELPKIECAFFLHSMFGMGWLLAGHIALVYSWKWGPKLHKRFSYGAVTIFVGHILVALYSLICDVVEHHPISRMMLLLNAMQCARLMTASIHAIKNGDLKTHQILMLFAYIYSTEGSGTIRQVENFMWMLGYSPSSCQRQYDGKATFCVTSYSLRMIFIRLLSFFHLWCISMLRQDEELRKYVARDIRNFFAAASVLYVSWYVFGLGAVGAVIENGGFIVLAIFQAFSPTYRVQKVGVSRR